MKGAFLWEIVYSHICPRQVDNLLHLSHMILLGEAGCPPGVGAMKTPSIKIG